MGAIIRCYGFRDKQHGPGGQSGGGDLHSTIFPSAVAADTYFEMREMDHTRWERVELRIEVMERAEGLDQSA